MVSSVVRLGGDEMFESFELDEGEKAKIIKNFTNADGTLKSLPAQRKKKLILLEYMLRDLEAGRSYKEAELNEHIKKFHPDFATVRREFVMAQFMYRQDRIYELNPPEMWPV